ncbi:hypothetical protein IQ03_00426 [Gemmobacter caeni]|uniref:Uncharacterized protein n=1 Tax=Gemmobacter caeni TaxID=589035 RepID=A0A2T6BBQ0_9RHOB|nr:hypothetical protein [Gemmobacter caeni]PTX53510.1 hypothetical protein C8N34_101428 [Gemmobacter caeni]TWJ05621.1 hypothetical protein IQ03_00426 [Gemmobacter caeni]
MWSRPDSMIAQILYTGGPVPNFAALVSMIDRHLTRHFPAGHSLTWDHDDIASFDAGALRLLLAKNEPAPSGYTASLTLAAGPRPDLEEGTLPLLSQENLSRVLTQIVEGTLRQHPAETVLWQHRPEPLDSDLADAVALGLPAREEVDYLSNGESANFTTVPTVWSPHPVPQPSPQPRPEMRHEDGHDRAAMARVRDALYGEMPAAVTPQPKAEASPQMRLAVHAMNCTLIAVALPVGTAMMAYSFRKGENLAASARALALTGMGLALWHNVASLPLPV